MTKTFRFFSESSAAQEIVEIHGDNEWEIQDTLDLAWEENDRAARFDGVENYHGPLEG